MSEDAKKIEAAMEKPCSESRLVLQKFQEEWGYDRFHAALDAVSRKVLNNG